jgi:hypothetical protein
MNPCLRRGRRKRELQRGDDLGVVVPLLSQGGLWKKQNRSCQVASGRMCNQASAKAGAVFGVVSTISSRISLTWKCMDWSPTAPQRSDKQRVLLVRVIVKRSTGPFGSVQQPFVESFKNCGIGSKTALQCEKTGGPRQGRKLRLPRVNANWVRDNNDPQIDPTRARRHLAFRKLDELLDR